MDTRVPPEHNCTMQKHGIVLMVTLVLSTAGCISGAGVRPYRLYPAGPQPLGPEQVSTLALNPDPRRQLVDDKDVSSLGGYFELVPGCHIISVPSPSPSRYNVGGTTPRWTFALPMRAGHQYQVRGNAFGKLATERFTIRVYESDLGGKETRAFEHAEGPNDIEACKQEAARTLAEGPGASRP